MRGTRINRKIELAANLVIVLAGLFVGARVLFPGLFSSGRAAALDTIGVGAKVAIHPSGGALHDRTLVLALREGCHYCAESAPFYQEVARLLKETQKSQVMAILPEPAAEGRKYLAEMGAAIDDVQQAQFHSLKIAYTPTLLLLDGQGAVKRVWVGKLSPQREIEVLRELGL